jgi:copper chaperone
VAAECDDKQAVGNGAYRPLIEDAGFTSRTINRCHARAAGLDGWIRPGSASSLGGNESVRIMTQVKPGALPLDLPTMARLTLCSFHHFKEFSMLVYRVDDMTCGHCVSTITNAVRTADATAKLEIDLGQHLVRIEPGRARPEQFKQAIAEAGYTPVETPAPSAAPSAARSGGCCGSCS